MKRWWDSAAGVLWRVRALLWWGSPQRALALLQRLRPRHPHDPALLATHAHLLAQTGQLAQACALLQELVGLQPDSAAHWFNLGFVQERLGLAAAAEASFRRALALDERLDRAWYGLGLALVALGRLDEALQALQRNTELQPMSPYAWAQMARIHADRAETEQARRIIRHLQGFEPKVAAQLARETGLSPTG